MAGDLSTKAAADKLIDSNSIDHSYNKCITVHMTQNASFSDNVCARITGHIFYEESGSESNITFTDNLGMGAMSNNFDINDTATASRDALISQYYWVGDNMVKPGGLVFDQFNVLDTDDQSNSSRGQCAYINGAGLIIPNEANFANPCPSTVTVDGKNYTGVYFEPPSGFWITNPSAKLSGNSIAGCQDDGKAYWYVPAPDSTVMAVKWIPVGPGYSDPHGVFESNRGSACYQGLYDDQDVAQAESIFGYQGGVHDAAHQQVDI